MITQNFDLNLIPDSSPVVIHCDQYDKGTGRLVVSLYVDAISYSPSGTAIIQGIKPDNKGFAYNASMSGNVVTADLTEQMTAVAGRVRCQIVVTESTGRTGTFVFILDVQKSALPSDADMSESDYQLIEEAIEETRQAVFDAEAWAIGERGGVPVSSDDPTYHNNAEYWANVAAQYAQGGLKYKGSILFASIPTTGMVEGDMYNIEDDFITDSRFQEGAGKSAQAGTNIAWNSNNKWDLLAVAVIPTMTTSVMGIGKPDGITTGVNNGTFFAKGVTIVADVNSGGTQYGSNWLYYHGTTDVITPDIETEYRVTENGDTSLYYWTGTAYEQLTSAGSGGDFVGLLGSTEITSTKPDLNSYTNIGTYYRTDTSFNVSNYPASIGATDKFLLIVQKTADDSNTIIQSYLGEGGFSQRSSSNGGITWFSWTRYADYNDAKDVFYLKGINVISGANTDLDLCTSLTSYRKSLTTFVPLHAPSGIVATDRFLLYNLRVSGSTPSSEPTVQLIYSISSDGTTNMYTRGRVSSSDSWSAWKKAGEGSGGGGDYMGLYGMTEIQSSDGQGTTLLDLNQYTSVGNYFCDGKAYISTSHYAEIGLATISSGTHYNAKFLLYVRKINDAWLMQDLYLVHETNVKRLIHYQRHAEYTNNTWIFGTWRAEVDTGSISPDVSPMSLGNGMFNVLVNNVTDGDVLKRVNGKWSNKPIGEATGLAGINTTGATNTTGSTITAGTYFYLDGVLVRALLDIANGASFTLNTNYEVVTAGALNNKAGIYELIHHETVNGVQAIELAGASVSGWLNESIVKKYCEIIIIYNIYSSSHMFSADSLIIPQDWFNINASIGHALDFDHNNVADTSLVAGSVKYMFIISNYQITYVYGYKKMYADETAAGLTHHIYIYGVS